MVGFAVMAIILVGILKVGQGFPANPYHTYASAATAASDVPEPDCEVRETRGARKTRSWNHFKVYIDPAFDTGERKILNDVIYELRQVIPCVHFSILSPDTTPTGDYVKTVKGKDNGCNSHIGRVGGAQVMNLESPGCMKKRIVMHEMIHALGFHHEHTRPDRDDHVEVLWNNVEMGKKYNFRKRRRSKTYGIPYDLQSIMHYRKNSFTKNGFPTLVAKGNQDLGSTDELRESDKRKLKALYKC